MSFAGAPASSSSYRTPRPGERSGARSPGRAWPQQTHHWEVGGLWRGGVIIKGGRLYWGLWKPFLSRRGIEEDPNRNPPTYDLGSGRTSITERLGKTASGKHSERQANTASFQKFNLEKWAQPLGDLNFQRASRSDNKQWFWDLRPSTWNLATWNCDNWPRSEDVVICMYVCIYIYIYI